MAGDALDYDPAAHYDRVTQAWLLLMGDNLHYGIFTTGDEELDEATAELTRRMTRAGGLRQGDSAGLRVLDVGCGSGAPACALAEEYDVSVLGISTSAVGIETATARAAALGLESVTFEQREGTSNGLPDESFDLVWVMESSHLMRDRPRLISESARVLRPGGRLVLCDLMRWRAIGFLEVRARRVDFATLRTAFGDAHMEPLSYYASLAEDAGLEVERTDDLTEASRPTFDRWRGNAAKHREAVVGLIGEDGLDAFVRSCDILEEFWRDGTMGYGLVAAAKSR